MSQDEDQKGIIEAIKELKNQVDYTTTQLSWEFLRLKTHLEKEIRDTQKILWDMGKKLEKEAQTKQ